DFGIPLGALSVEGIEGRGIELAGRGQAMLTLEIFHRFGETFVVGRVFARARHAQMLAQRGYAPVPHAGLEVRPRAEPRRRLPPAAGRLPPGRVPFPPHWRSTAARNRERHRRI